jgi:two-component system response regulator PhcR
MKGTGMMEAGRNAVTVLYVDDEAMARKYFVRAYESEFDMLEADGVDAALAVLASGRHIDVLVTDYRMPLRVGGELLRHVELHHPHIVRILVTAYADKDVLIDTVNGGDIFRVLEKPLDMDMVRSTLHLAAQRARDRGTRQATLRAIEEALAFLAHELNTPLATIANFARGIQRRGDPAPAQLGHAETPVADAAEMAAAAARIHENVRYCQAVLNSFVESVKLASTATGNLSGHAGSSARQLLSSLLDVYPLTPAQRGAIALDVRSDFAVAALPNCVALVLSSVLSNALRAVDGHPEPALSFLIQAGTRPQIRLNDNGSGIPREILDRLLLDPITMHANGGGSGWGLIFCNRIMQSFGGSIEVTSEQGRYTTVTLNFPAIIKEYHDDRP